MIIRKCPCPCGREFQVTHQSNPKQYFERACANKHAARYYPKRHAGARGTSKPRFRKEFQFCDAAA